MMPLNTLAMPLGWGVVGRLPLWIRLVQRCAPSPNLCNVSLIIESCYVLILVFIIIYYVIYFYSVGQGVRNRTFRTYTRSPV